MVRYLGFRLFQAVGVLWAAFTVSFAVLYLLPSDPVSIAAGADAGTPPSMPLRSNSSRRATAWISRSRCSTGMR